MWYVIDYYGDKTKYLGWSMKKVRLSQGNTRRRSDYHTEIMQQMVEEN